ncbi:hypothetical protein [uncultured Microbacterium sp.]|uniref:hypothetical protein n=1 Tax=uncultured Microbacterium sp. TaxID=191216 RepID=UPI002592A099|nr:hypothetical protein [uncultured Microbacterium sp.]
MSQPGDLSDEERNRLSGELKQVEGQQAEALKEGFSLGGGLGNHEQRAKLDEQAETLRQQLGVESSAPQTRRANRGWIGWVVLALACVAVVTVLWIVGGGALA